MTRGATAIVAFPSAPADVPAFVRDWVAQLLSDENLSLLRQAGERQVEVHLYAHRGRSRRSPAIRFNAVPDPERSNP